MKILRTADVPITDDEESLLVAIDGAIALARGLPRSREASLTITKLQEALFWVRQRAWESEIRFDAEPTIQDAP